MTTLRELDELDAKATQGEWLALRHSKLVGQQFIPQKRLHASRKKNKPIGKMLSRSKDGAGKANTAFIAAIVNFWRSDGRKLCEDGMKWRAQKTSDTVEPAFNQQPAAQEPHMPNPVTLVELRALREKATKGRWKCSGDGYSAIEDENGRTLYYDEGTATMENNELICALIEYFDLPSTQAMLEAGERVAAAFPEHAVTGIASALREYARERQTMNGTWDLRSQRLVDWAILIEAGKATAESNARDAERYRLARDRQHGVCFWTEWAKPMWRYEQAADDALDAEAARKAQGHLEGRE